MKAYIDSLPDGLASYPDFVQKASIYRLWIENTPAPFVPRELPPELDDLVRNPRPVSTWVSVAQTTALVFALTDARFGGEQALLQGFLQFNRKLLQGPLYQALMAVVSPAMALRGASARWGAFHRGITLDLAVTGHGATVELRYPPHLVSQLFARGYTTTWRATLEAAGARGIDVELERWSATGALFRAGWR